MYRDGAPPQVLRAAEVPGEQRQVPFPKLKASRLQGFKADHKSREAVRLGKVNEATSYDNALPYHVGLKRLVHYT